MPNEPHDLGATIAGVRAGDPRALALLYEHWFDRCVAWAHASTGRDEAFCLDAAQDTFMTVIRAIPMLHDERSLASWLRKTVTARCIDRLRAESRRVKREQQSRIDTSDSISPSDELIDRLREELRTLDPAAASMLDLRYRAGMTLESIGRVFGIAPGAADGRIRRAQAALRERIEEAPDA
ncbi:MAG: sigma-70 family RNA polymerase sigma factor [Planctomycetota bacterium]